LAPPRISCAVTAQTDIRKNGTPRKTRMIENAKLAAPDEWQEYLLTRLRFETAPKGFRLG
jgi:hypothetical protein